jgi:hypothetical protein
MLNVIPKNDILKQLWIGTCTIYEHQPVKDPITHQTVSKLVTVLENEPCRVSYSYNSTTSSDTGVATVGQITTLFIRPDVDIKSGSTIEVTQHGKVSKFNKAGKPSVYTNHQEIVISLDEDV